MQETALRRREQVAEGTFAFHFDKPAGFSHQAGQNALLTLPDGSEGHTFTIASAPHERDLMFATRMRDSAYKRALAAAPIGSKFKLDGRAGVMVLHEDEHRPAVFLAGGIGITPFLAMARDAEARHCRIGCCSSTAIDGRRMRHSLRSSSACRTGISAWSRR